MLDLDLMSTLARVALVLGILLVAAAVAFTFAPSKAIGSTCGTWIAPEWSDTAVDELATDARAQGTGPAGAAIVRGARMSQAACADTLSTRRSLALASLALAVAAPTGLLWIGRGTTSRRQATTSSTA